MENGPFEDVFPIKNRDFPLLCLFTGGYKFFSFTLKFPFLGGFNAPIYSTCDSEGQKWMAVSRNGWVGFPKCFIFYTLFYCWRQHDSIFLFAHVFPDGWGRNGRQKTHHQLKVIYHITTFTSRKTNMKVTFTRHLPDFE